MVKLHLKIGQTPVVIEADDVKEAFTECELICQLPSACSCGSQNIIPAYSKAASSGDEFFFLKCRDCLKEFKIGQRREDKQLFPKVDSDGADEQGWCQPYKRAPRDRDDRRDERRDDRREERPAYSRRERDEPPAGRYKSPSDAGRGERRGRDDDY